MIVDILPNEILQHIFRNLRGSEVFVCSKVCRRWEAAVDELSDEFWKEICSKEHSETHETAYRKANLSWRELYISLNLWADVASTDVRIHMLPNKYVKKFQVLSDGILACPYSSKSGEGKPKNYVYDTIIYYDVTTLQELQREYFTFQFLRFEENNYFIILSSLYKQYPFGNLFVLHVILKQSKKHFVFRRLLYNRRGRAAWLWILHENEIYFPGDRMNHINRLRLLKENNNFTLNIEDIQHSEKYLNMRAVTKINDEQTNIFNADCRVLSIIGKELKPLCRLNLKYGDTDIDLFKKFGFKMRHSDIYGRFPYLYGKLLIHRTIDMPLTINLYYDTNEINMRDMTPVKSISLEELSTSLYNKANYQLYLDQIDIVETLKGHRIILSCHTNTLSIDNMSTTTYLMYATICAIDLVHKNVQP